MYQEYIGDYRIELQDQDECLVVKQDISITEHNGSSLYLSVHDKDTDEVMGVLSSFIDEVSYTKWVRGDIDVTFNQDAECSCFAEWFDGGVANIQIFEDYTVTGTMPNFELELHGSIIPWLQSSEAEEM
ncbi:hypothetical protein RLOatenuis_4960 [Rickettsiales bacterium]|nr:hypothetical protein RLOatenuis_4960 [Rickettsiales bacterium]